MFEVVSVLLMIVKHMSKIYSSKQQFLIKITINRKLCVIVPSAVSELNSLYIIYKTAWKKFKVTKIREI